MNRPRTDLRSLFLRRGWILPLTLSLFVDNVRGTPVRAAALLCALAWAGTVVHRLRRRPRLPLPLVLFLSWAAGGAFFSAYRAGTLGELSLLAGAVALWTGAAAVWDAFPDEKAVFPKALVVLGLLKAGTALALPPPGGTILLNPGDAGTANIALTPMFLALGVILGARAEGRGRRAAWLCLLAATLWLCARWNAMAALLGLAAGIPLENAFHRRSRGFLWGAGAGVLLVSALLFSPSSPRWLQYNPDNPARFERLAIWRDSLAYACAHPWTGTGLGTFEQYYPRYKSLPGLRTANFAHNEWIQVLCETGLPGAALIGVLLWGLARRIRRRGSAVPGAAAGIVVLSAWACLYFPFRSDPLLFAGALMAAALWSDVPVGPSPGALVPAALTALVVLSQGAAQTAERWGGAAWNGKRYDAAFRRFQLAARFDPLEPRYLMHQVECLRSLDRKAETLPLLERAVALKPRDVWVRRTLAVARLNLVGPAAARETYRPILDLSPGVEQFRREFAELDKMEKG